MRQYYLGALSLLASCFGGCALLAPAIDSVKEAGLIESDRRVSLDKEIKRFHDILFFGNVDDAMVFADDDERSKLAVKLKKIFKAEKIVENTVDDVQYQKESREADAHLTVKYYRNTDFLIKERTIVEHWKFHSGGNWFITSYQDEDVPKT